ncbi:hypothetical protein [Micromonospora auratinigra]|uniref:Uncharacterized protein n=1 Tax=Micromonospora auratinigra TaxID=261654 RepID=A0A1A8ZA11_9ACTN|nr:hypothetical protein [Micromonospora auratinigra]SBT40670.1 hypothetical protein GA0070611_1341 [Micromonospora auratinigra]
MKVWIARDPSKTAVALRPVDIGSRPHRREWGSVVDVTPGPPMTAKAADRRAKFQLLLVLMAASYFCTAGGGAYWWLILLASGAFMMAIFAASSKAGEPGKVVTPELGHYPEAHRLLTGPQERSEFDRLLKLAERVGKTQPALKRLVDPDEAGSLLAEAVWEGAKSLARKEEIRAVRDDLKRHALEGSGQVSRSRLDLLQQQQRANALWKEVDAELDKLRSHLSTAAEAGEAFIRDRELDDTLNRTEKALAKLSTDEILGSSLASEQLADETNAVIQAYRELNELYGGKR